jgi:uncharacterized membrane protein
MRSAALTLALLILLSGVAPVTAVVPPGADDGGGPAVAPALATTSDLAQVEPDRPATEIFVQLEADADARWTISYRYPLTGESEVAAFRDLEREFEAGQADLGLDAGVFRSMAELASESTGRNMQIRDVERSATVERNVTTEAANTTTGTQATATTTTGDAAAGNATGVLRLSFTWTNFLERTDDGNLVLGDVFATPDGGTWLSSLGDEQQLVVGTPPGFDIVRTSLSTRTRNGSLVIDGPREFSSEERLSVTYAPRDQSELPWTLILGGAVGAVLLLALVVFFALRGRSRPSGAPDGTALTNGGETTPAGTDDPGSPGTESTTGTTAPETAAPDEGSATATGTEDGTDEADEEPDFELLSDEERVEYLLDEHGGRMKQGNIVKETGWSDAKVSQLLSSMAEEGRVEKLRLGRENLISLPDQTVVDDRDEN